MPDFKYVLRSLFPPGIFFDYKRGSAFDKLIDALATEFQVISELLYGFATYFSYVSNPDWFNNLLGVTALNDDHRVSAAKSVLDRRGSLGRAYVEGRLRAIGHADFKIVDPSEWPLGFEPVADTNSLGILTVTRKLLPYQELRAGFHAGDTVHSQFDTRFENDLNALIPAHITAKFYYGDDTNA